MSTYEPIASQTLGSAASSVTFSSIPQGYTDLILVSRMGNSNAATGFGSGLTLNNDAVATGKLSFTILYGNGSAAGSFRWTTSTSGNVTVPLGIEATTLNAGGMSVMQLMNYSNSTTFKTILTRGGAAGSDTLTYVSLWQDKSPINKITIYPNDATNTILSGSTFSLYGIQVGASTQKAQGGNIVTTDGTYVYHTFTSSGSFIPNEALTVDYLVVAGGGGGGGKNTGGGGGAGGYRTSIGGSALSVTAKPYPIIVGAGGSGGTSPSQSKGSNGSNSIFSTITSSGGGGGGHGVPPNAPDARLNGSSGGSGGGGGGTDSGGGGTGGSGNAGSYSPVEGYAGANGSSTTVVAGGGGGSSSTGNAGSSNTGGAGGTGTANSISGSSVTYAAGGGGGGNSTGGAGGSGIGGAGAGGGSAGNPSTQQAGAGTVNTGSGGGGAGGWETLLSGGAGGSGIVIIRYAI